MHVLERLPGLSFVSSDPTPTSSEGYWTSVIGGAVKQRANKDESRCFARPSISSVCEARCVAITALAVDTR